MVEDRRAGMHWSMKGKESVGEECLAISEELSDVDDSVEDTGSSAGTDQDVQDIRQDDGDVESGPEGSDDNEN